MPVDTKKYIIEAFFTMAKQKPVDKITVKDLVEACNISRQTFYYHFQDILEVIEWSITQVLEQTLARSLEAETPEDALCIFIAASREGDPLIRQLFRSQKREQVERMMVHAVETYLKTLIQEKAPGLPLRYADMETALHYWSYGITGVLMESREKKSADDRKLARQLYLLLTGKLVEFS